MFHVIKHFVGGSGLNSQLVASGLASRHLSLNTGIIHQQNSYPSMQLEIIRYNIIDVSWATYLKKKKKLTVQLSTKKSVANLRIKLQTIQEFIQ